MPQQNVIELQGDGPATNYDFSVSGLCVPEAGLFEPEYDTMRTDGASGWVTRPENVDIYHFTGTITDFQFITGECLIRLNGSPVSASAVVGMGGSTGGNGDGQNGNGDGQDGGQNGQNGDGNGNGNGNGDGGQNGAGGVFGDDTVRLIAGAAVLRALLG